MKGEFEKRIKELLEDSDILPETEEYLDFFRLIDEARKEFQEAFGRFHKEGMAKIVQDIMAGNYAPEENSTEYGFNMAYLAFVKWFGNEG